MKVGTGIARAPLPWVVATVVMLLSVGAHAGSIQTLTFSGTAQYGSDSSASVFGPASTSLKGEPYSVTFSYNPSSLTQVYSTDSCGSAPGSSCYFSFNAASALTEVLTSGSNTQTITWTQGGINLLIHANGTDEIQLNVSSNSGSLWGDFIGPSFFLSPGNANNPNLATFTDVPLTWGEWNDTAGSLTFGGNNLTELSADPPPAVPEPSALALLAAGVAGLTAVGSLRRRRSRPALT
jgi:hypothetical protein